MSKRLRPPVKTQGSRWSIAPWIVEHFPGQYEEYTYCEPFCSSASVLLEKQKSSSEMISDTDRGLLAILKALRDEPKEFISRLKRVRYTERAFRMAQRRSENFEGDYFDLGVDEFILRKLSRGGQKKTYYEASLDFDVLEEQLLAIAERLIDVVMLCADFKTIVPIWDEENTLMYFDPPHLHSGIIEGASNLFSHEMSVEDHMYLLHLAKNARGKVIISGYSSPLYNRSLKGWKCKKRNVQSSHVECLWFNY